MPSASTFQSRIRAALLVASALMLMLAVGMLPGGARAYAQVDPTPSSRPAPRSTRGPATTGPDEEESPPVTRTPESVERAPRTTRPAPAQPRTTRRSGSGGGGGGVAASTTMPTMPPSTAVPALLVAGPNNTMTGPQEASDNKGGSTGAALKWVILGLVLVGLAIAGMTVAFWLHTKPAPSTGDDGDGVDGDGDDGPEAADFPPAPDTPAGAAGVPVGGWDPDAGVTEVWDPSPAVGAGSWDQPQGAAPGPAEPYDPHWGSS